MIDPNLDDTERQIRQALLRDQLDAISANSTLDYHSTSLDLVSHDINQSTVGELAMLITGAVLVVVLPLDCIPFGPRCSLPVGWAFGALVWTYGGMAMAGIQFSILEVAVAPVVLGLGIDYSIHLQRRYNTFRAEGETASVAWLRGFETLKVPWVLQ